MNEKKELRDKLLSRYEAGKILYADMSGIHEADIDDFISQPADGILYDLNRNESTVLTFIDDPKWINDYAVAKTIRALKGRIEELESKL